MRRIAFPLTLVALSSAALVHCSDETTVNPVDAGKPADATSDSATVEAAVDSGNVDRGPTQIPFAGEPNGLWWDYGTSPTLYISDDDNNRIMKWTDTGGLALSVQLPDPEPDAGAGLGQVIRLVDGTMVVTRFGSGTGGAILVVDKNGDAGVLSPPDGGLSTARRRIGLGLLADGTILETYFTGGAGSRVGVVAKVNILTAKETDFISGFSNPIGVLFNENRIYVSDQDLNTLARSGLDGGSFDDAATPGDGGGEGGVVREFAPLDQPDLICQGPDGVIFAGSKGGTVYAIDRNAVVSSVATGLKEVHGCAYDGAHKRLFVAEHDAVGLTSAIRIYPID